MRRALLAVLIAASVATAAAQVCTTELQGALPGVGASPGQVAAALFARAVQLVEPALPPLRGGDGPVAGAGPAAEAVTYLHRRHLLPEGWTADAHTPEAWAAMLARFLGGYRLDPIATTGADTRAMLQEAGRAVAAAGAAVRPLPVFAIDGDRRVTLFVVIWNWTPQPRLLVLRPPEGLVLGPDGGRADAAAVLAAMGTCAVTFAPYAYAEEDVALRLFVDQAGRSTLTVLGTDPPAADVASPFEGDDVVDVLTFRHPALAGLDALSVAIEGPSLGVGAALYVLANVRTNAGIGDVQRALALP
jgi:hypothetical protein